MADTRKILPAFPRQAVLTSLGAANAEHIRILRLQRARARQMVKLIRAMCHRALEMQKPPRIAHPW